MAKLPTIAGIYRVAYLWTGYGLNPVNVFHYRIGGATPTLAQIALNLGNAHASGAHDGLDAIGSLLNCSAVQITPLDGTTAGQVLPLGRTLTGHTTGEVTLNNAAILSLHTTQRGPRGRGRVYLGPIGESVQNSGVLDAPTTAAMLTGWQAIHSYLAGLPAPMTPVVASYVHADAHDVSGIRVDNFVGSQRRRLDHVAGR